MLKDPDYDTLFIRVEENPNRDNEFIVEVYYYGYRAYIDVIDGKITSISGNFPEEELKPIIEDIESGDLLKPIKSEKSTICDEDYLPF